MKAITFGIKSWKWPFMKLLGCLGRHHHWGRLADIALREVPRPSLPADDWVRIKTRLAGICGSDIAMITLQNPPNTFERGLITFPMIPGHENVGTVIERGPAARDIPEGLRVNVEGSLPCAIRGIEPPCPACRVGQFTTCWNITEGPLGRGRSIGFAGKIGGTWAEEFVAHRSQIFPVPESVSDEQAVLVDPLASSLHGVLARRPREGETVLVFGCGTIGLGIIAAIRALGLTNGVITVAKYGFQKEVALKFGADEVWTGADLAETNLIERIAAMYGTPAHKGVYGKKTLIGGVDMAYDAIGSSDSVDDCLRVVRANGTVVVVGMSHAHKVDWDAVTYKQLVVIGAHGRSMEDWHGQKRHTYPITQELIAGGKLPTEGLLTHTFPLEKYREALATATSKARTGAIHIAFRF